MPTLLRSLALTALSLALAVPVLAQARLQVIHNAADPAAAEVDVYVNGDLLLDDFAFRTATPFIDVPADTPLFVAIAPGSSTGAGDAVFTRTYTLPDGSTTQLIANGVLDPGAFAANPDGRSTAFDLLVGGSARESGGGPGVLARVVHGATDAPTVDARAFGAPFVDDASYSGVTGYVSLPPTDFTIAITTADGAPVAGFLAPLDGAAGAALTVLASGFLDPAANQNGAAFGLLAVFPDGTAALLDSAPMTARLQIIHNAADPAAEVVDVYVNGDLLLDDLAFRTATPFIDVPGGVGLEIGVAPGSSTGASDAIYTETVGLPVGVTAQIIASGVLSPDDFADNPDGRSTAFDLLVDVNAQESADADGDVALRVVHGATDAPTVDVRTGGAVLVDDATYRDITGYLSVPAAAYTLDITTADGAPVASFIADVSASPGIAATILASGFLSPEDDQDGPAFGLLAVLPDGATVLLPSPQTARLQVIHNAADPAAEIVDVYVNGDLLLDDLAFRTATPFIDVPAGVELNVSIAPGDSDDVGDAIFSQAYTLPDGSTTQLIANGVLSPDDFADNPDGVEIGFQLLVGGSAAESSGDENVAVRVVHGATDAPTVDVRTGGAILVDDASYTDVTGYLSVAPANYELDITTADGTPVASFLAPLASAGGGAVTVLASGFLSPDDNQGGAAFGLLAVFPDGTEALLPNLGTARLQVIHNAADPAAAEVDVYVNGDLLLDDFAFRTATPFIDVPSNTALEIAVAPGTSTGAGDAVFTQTFTLPGASTTQLIANGVLSPDDFAANPDGIATAFELLVGANAREDGNDDVAVRVVHGATDAPTVDVRTGGTVLVDDASYTDVTGYLSVPPADYVLDITTADGTPVASFTAPLSVPADTAVTVLASGFLTPAANQDGPAFGLLAVFPDGNALLLPVATDAAAGPGEARLELGLPAPNPLRSRGAVSFSLDAPGAARLALYDALGRQVAVLAEGDFAADRHQASLDTRDLASGVYVLRLEAPTGVRAQTLTVVR